MTDAPVSKAFGDPALEREADSLGLWVFLAAEAMQFGAIFVGYLILRLKYPLAFADGSHALSLPLGTLNTAILLTSSFSMAIGVECARTEDFVVARRAFWITATLGLAFFGVKTYEYWDDVQKGLLPLLGAFNYAGPDPVHVALFFNVYLMMTGLHAVHLLVGMAIVALVALPSRLPPPRRASRAAGVGLYWHFVDIIWVFLFPLLYLVHR